LRIPIRATVKTEPAQTSNFDADSAGFTTNYKVETLDATGAIYKET
jgi:hypothetical protein